MSTTRTVPITANYSITANDSINTILSVNANAQPITLVLPNTDNIADDTWTIEVTDTTHTITIVDSKGENTIYLGDDTAFVPAANLLTTGTTNLHFDGTHFTFLP